VEEVNLPTCRRIDNGVHDNASNFIILCKLASSVEALTTKPDDDHPKNCVWYVVAFELFKLPVFIANNSSVVVCFAKAGGF
jgi:hypothetical protein